ncbi:WhiB family transcriptional regulator [Kitasatospora sp. NPDC048722]|uniref:WhiB family transcriptional regulator n=1 Tax=Kitasatospora sp. NPDC048722 TaxID=3155639 RepID=UPI0033D6501F
MAQLHSLLSGAATRAPHRTARPAAAVLIEARPDGAGDLRGAACAGADTDLFYPDPEEIGVEAAEWAARRAKMICAGCPVRTMCLELALERFEKHGIFGGKTARERASLHERRLKVARRERRAAGGAH